MTPALDSIYGCESKYVEFKRDYSSTMLKTVSAYANDHDGRIVMGLSDHGQVVGVTDAVALRLKIENAINDSIHPRPYFEIETEQFESCAIVIVKVFKGDATPYYYQDKAYVRSDTASVPADRHRLGQLVLAGQNIQFDEMATTCRDLTFKSLERALRGRLQIGQLNDDLLKSLGLMRKSDYTNAACLFSDQNPLSDATLALIAYDESGIGFADRLVLVNQSIIDQFDHAVDFWRKHTNVAEQITGAYRQTVEEIPLIAFREAIANALVHRDYQAPGHIKAVFFTNRVEITSPGGLPVGISKEEYLAGRLSVARNRSVADVFYRLGIIERLATGIRRIKESYQGLAVQPSFAIDPNSITVILPKAVKNDQKNPQPDFGPLSGNDRVVLEYLRQNGTMTRRDVEIALDIGKTRAYQIIDSLLERRLIVNIGSGRNTHYRSVH